MGRTLDLSATSIAASHPLLKKKLKKCYSGLPGAASAATHQRHPSLRNDDALGGVRSKAQHLAPPQHSSSGTGNFANKFGRRNPQEAAVAGAGAAKEALLAAPRTAAPANTHHHRHHHGGGAPPEGLSLGAVLSAPQKGTHAGGKQAAAVIKKKLASTGGAATAGAAGDGHNGAGGRDSDAAAATAAVAAVSGGGHISPRRAVLPAAGGAASQPSNSPRSNRPLGAPTTAPSSELAHALAAAASAGHGASPTTSRRKGLTDSAVSFGRGRSQRRRDTAGLDTSPERGPPPLDASQRGHSSKKLEPPHRALVSASAFAAAAAAPPPLPDEASSEKLSFSALIMAFLYVSRALPGRELAAIERRGAEFFATRTCRSHSFTELVRWYKILLGPGNLHTKTKWLRRTRLWRLVFLMVSE